MIERDAALARLERLTVGEALSFPLMWPSLAGVAAVGLLLLPWLPFTRVANPGYVTARVFVDTPQYLYTLLGMLVLGAWIASRDGWLGAGSLYVTLSAFWHPSDLALATAHWVALGAAGIVLVGSLSLDARTWLVRILLVSCVAEVAYTAVQLGRRDLFFFGFMPMDMVQPIGTLGNPKYLGAMLAMAAPLAPLWLLPVFVAGIIMSKSALAAVAMIAGLMVRYAPRDRQRLQDLSGHPVIPYVLWLVPIGALGGLMLLDVPWFRGASLDSLWSRLSTWHLAIASWWWHGPLSWLFGSGFGSFFVDVPKLQVQIGVNPVEVFFQGHSEPIQLLYEGGLVAWGLLGGWICWRGGFHRAPAFPSVVALAILAAGLHVLHAPTVAPTALLVLGLASARDERP